MTELTKQDALALPPDPDLDAVCEYVCFGDDLRATEERTVRQRDRLERAVAEWIHSHDSQHGGSVQFATGQLAWPPWAAWAHRQGQPWQSAIEQHVAAWRAQPRPFSRDVAADYLVLRHVRETANRDQRIDFILSLNAVMDARGNADEFPSFVAFHYEPGDYARAATVALWPADRETIEL